MYVVKMDEDKELVGTIVSTIYQGERNADTLVFLVPMYYEGKNLADCTMLLRYILPDGIGNSEEIEMEPEPYKEHYRYHLKVSSKFTETSGQIEYWLSAIDIHDNLVLKSSSNFIEIEPSKDITEYLSPEDLNQLDALSAEVEQLKITKADDIVYDDDNNLLQLSAQGELIGTQVDLSSLCGEESGEDSGGDTADELDEVIYF